MAKMTDEELRALLARNPEVGVAGAPRTIADTPRMRIPQGPAIPPGLFGINPERAALEETEQILVMGWAGVAVQAYPILECLIHVPNGGFRRPGEAARLKAAGVRKGVPDLLLLAPSAGYTGLAIELKRADRSNHPTTEQLAWLARLRVAGWAVAVCYGAPEAIEVLSAYCTEDGIHSLLEGKE